MTALSRADLAVIRRGAGSPSRLRTLDLCDALEDAWDALDQRQGEFIPGVSFDALRAELAAAYKAGDEMERRFAAHAYAPVETRALDAWRALRGSR